MSFGRIVGLVFLFLFFEVFVGFVSNFVFQTNPLIGCAAMTALAALIWFVYIATTRWMMRPRLPMQMPMAPGQPMQGMPGMPGPGNLSDPESNEIAGVIREGNKVLAQSPRYAALTNKPTIADLPLYVVMGAEQSGKTSALYHSGTNLSLLAGEAQRDLQIIPTRLMNLWFAQDAVFADFSGRISGEDNSRWMRALSALRRPPAQKKPWLRLLEVNAPQTKLRGVVLCVDLTLFTGNPDPTRITAAARQINERLQSVSAVFGVSFPVYVLFTKSDNVSYFGEFFARLSDEEERRIVGATLAIPEGYHHSGDVYAETENNRLGTALDRLIASLGGKRLSFLARESDPRAKTSIYEHPREWRRFRPELVRFLVEAFRPNVLAASPQLRGFYFSGVRQSAPSTSAAPAGSSTSFDPGKTILGGTMMFSAGRTQMRGAPEPPRGLIRRWAFLGQLFQDVILADVAAAPEVPPDARQSMLQRVVFGGAIAVGALACLFWLVSWANNWSLLRDATQVAQAAEQRVGRNVTLLDADRLHALDDLRIRIESLRNDQRGLLYRFGLYSGDRALEALRSEYFALFKRPFYERMVAGLESQFRTTDRVDLSNRIYSYRAITSGGCAPNEPILTSALPPVWQLTQSRTPDPQTADLAQRQIRFYASELAIENPYSKRPEDKDAVDNARKYLQGSGEDILQQMLADLNRDFGPAILAKYAPNYSGQILAPPQVDGAFTKQGWDALQAKLVKGDWKASDSCVSGGLVGNLARDQELRTRLSDLYTARYIDAWKRFLTDAHVDMSGTDADKSRKLKVLGDNRSPLLGTLAMVSDHTRFPQEASAQETMRTGIGSIVDTVKGIGQGTRPAAAPERKTGRAAVVQAFQPVHAVISVDDAQRQLVTETNNAYVTALKDFGDTLGQMGPNADPTSVMGVQQSRRQALSEVARLEGKFTFTDPAVNDQVKRILNEPLDLGRNLDPFKSDKDKINGAAGEVCRKVRFLQSKFPFNPKSEVDATIPEFNAVFAPQHLEAMKAAMAPFASVDGRGTVVPTRRELAIPKSVMDLYGRIIMISNAFYPPGSDQPRLQYEATISTTSAVERVQFYVNDKRISATPNKEDSKRFDWTGEPSRVGLTVTRRDDSPFGLFDRAWSIFRLMANADIPRPPMYEFNRLKRPGGVAEPLPDRNNKDTSIRLEIRPNSGPDVFAPGFLRVSCPVDPVR